MGDKILLTPKGDVGIEQSGRNVIDNCMPMGSMHGPVWYIYHHLYDKHTLNVGKYTVRSMNP